MRPEERLEQALESRDMALTEKLLAAALSIGKAVDARFALLADQLALAVFEGRFREAREHLKALAPAVASVHPDSILECVDARGALESGLPAADLPLSRLLAEAVREVLSSTAGDPFQAQARLSKLFSGLDPKVLPKPLERYQEDLSVKASWQARERGLQRGGAPTGRVQEHSDCWMRSLYDLRVPALDPLRRCASYDKFLALVDERFPGVRKSFSENAFLKLAPIMGLKATRHRADQRGLEELLARHGAVIASVGWFPKDASELERGSAWLRYNRHMVVISGPAGSSEARQFMVRDPLVPHETSHTIVELDLMRFHVYAVEPAGPDSARALREFARQEPPAASSRR